MKPKQKYNQTNPADFFKTPTWLENNLVVIFIYLALALIFFNKILSPSKMVFGTDFLAGAYMSRDFFKTHLADLGEIPMWIPYLYGGIPLYANVGDLYYPISWILRLLLPVHVYTAYLYIIQVWLAGVFTYLFLKQLKLSFWPRFLGGIAYMFTGFLVSLVYAGHEGRMAIISFLPAMLWIIHIATEKRKLVYFLVAGLILGFILLIPHVQLNYYLLATVFFYFLFRLYFVYKEQKNFLLTGKLLGYFVLVIVLGFLLTAILYLPFYTYIPHSPRGGAEGRGYEFATSWALNPEEVINLFIPTFSGILDNYWGRNPFKLHTEYLGAIPFFLAVLALIFSRRNKTVLFFTAVSLLALTVAFGGHTFLYKIYYNLIPGFKKFRAPSLAFFVVSFSLVVLGSIGLQNLIDKLRNPESNPKVLRPLWIVCGVVLLLCLIVAGSKDTLISMLGGLVDQQPQNLTRLENNYGDFVGGSFKFFLFITAFTFLLYLLHKRLIPLLLVGSITAVLLVADLWLIDNNFVKTIPPPEEIFYKDEIVNYLEKQPGKFRVLPYQYRNDNYLMLYKIDNIAGEHGNQLQRYNEFIGAGQKRMVDFHNLAFSNFLNLAGAKYVITQNPVALPDFKLVNQGTLRIYENTKVLPRVFLVSKYRVLSESKEIIDTLRKTEFDPTKEVILEEDPKVSLTSDSLTGEAEIIAYAPNNVAVKAKLSQPGFLVFTDNFYPDWSVYVDGKSDKIYRADYTFRAIYLTAGEHRVEFAFDKKYYNQGKLISGLSWGFLLLTVGGYFIISRRKTQRVADGSASSP